MKSIQSYSDVIVPRPPLLVLAVVCCWQDSGRRLTPTNPCQINSRSVLAITAESTITDSAFERQEQQHHRRSQQQQQQQQQQQKTDNSYPTSHDITGCIVTRDSETDKRGEQIEPQLT
jgi:succinyl-CoA synthetase beta subunit